MLLKLLFIASFAIEVFALKNLLLNPWAQKVGQPLTVTWDVEPGDGDIVRIKWVVLSDPPADTRHPTGIQFGAGTYDINVRNVTTLIPNTIQVDKQYVVEAFVPAKNQNVESNVIEVITGILNQPGPLPPIETASTVFQTINPGPVTTTEKISSSSTSAFTSNLVLSTPSTVILSSATLAFSEASVGLSTVTTSGLSASSSSTATTPAPSSTSLGSPAISVSSASSAISPSSASAASSPSSASSSGEIILPWPKAHWVAFAFTFGLFYTL